MVDVLDTLIDKQDNFEIVRDQIALILATESANQVAKATTEGKPEPDDWKFNVYTERSRPWEVLLESANDDGIIEDETPIVNVWFDNGTFPKNKGDTVKRQAFEVAYNIDCYGSAVNVDNPAGGYFTMDELASRNVQRTTRFIRNILMAGINTYLQLRGLVWQRWPGSITEFQPQQNTQNAQAVIAIRFVLNVAFNEFAPQATPENLEEIFVELSKDETGKVVAEMLFDTT